MARLLAWPAGRTRDVSLLALLAALLVCAVSIAPPWRLAELRVFDYLSTIAPPEPSAGSPIIVAIDEPSLAEIGLRWPWPRDLHAALVRALRGEGARAIGLDIIFAEPSSPEADRALAAALGPDVVLAADETVIRGAHADQHIRVEPLAAFTDAGARSGIASVGIDGDGVVRRIPSYGDGFARRLAEAAGTAAPRAPADALLQSFGPARTFETVSYYQALEPKSFLPAGTFRDRVVIVGLSMQSASGVDKGGPDLFSTSDTARSRLLLPGVELQTTIYENLVAAQFIGPLPAVWAAGTTLLAAGLAGWSVRRQSGWRSAVVAGVFILACVGASLVLIREARIYMPPLAPSLAFSLVAGVQAARDFAAERRRRLWITRAFSQYLSPVLVERLADDPTPLRLGGERRVLTVLFTDVRGFTSISERMKDDPEGLTRLMNRLLDPLSRAITAAGGTIDKYIGDSIMAFWNAPLEDPDHAGHAIAAALAMLEALERLNAELAAEGGNAPQLRIGIGINTGACVVGNMGSEMRFNYSALGDPVNLAARLESETKALGVSLLVGEETARLVAGRMPLAELGRITVKGKAESVAVFTPVPGHGEEALGLHRAIVADLHAGRLDAFDPRLAGAARALPELAGFYARLGDAL